jgi:hypothetical protein
MEVTAGRAEVAPSRSTAARLGVGARALLAAALILAIVGWVVRFFSRAPAEPTQVTQISSLAVLPMRNLSGDQEQDYFVDGMTEALITDLSRIGELTAISRSSAMRYKGTDKPLSEIARELQGEAGTPVAEICRKLGISQATYFRWKRRHRSSPGRPRPPDVETRCAPPSMSRRTLDPHR